MTRSEHDAADDAAIEAICAPSSPPGTPATAAGSTRWRPPRPVRSPTRRSTTPPCGVRRAVIDAEREELLRLRDVGRLPDSGLRVLERELDHEEGLLGAQRAT